MSPMSLWSPGSSDSPFANFKQNLKTSFSETFFPLTGLFYFVSLCSRLLSSLENKEMFFLLIFLFITIFLFFVLQLLLVMAVVALVVHKKDSHSFIKGCSTKLRWLLVLFFLPQQILHIVYQSVECAQHCGHFFMDSVLISSLWRSHWLNTSAGVIVLEDCKLWWCIQVIVPCMKLIWSSHSCW